MTITCAELLTLYPRVTRSLLGYARRLDRNTSDDLHADALCKLATLPYDPAWTRPDAVLYRIGQRAILDALRANRRHHAPLDAWGDRDIPGRHSTDRLAELRQLFSTGTARDRALIRGLARGLSGQELASAVGISHGAVRVAVSRLRSRLAAL